MNKTQTVQFSFNGKTLIVFCVALGDGDVSSKVLEYAKEAFEKLSPFIKNDRQVLYIRDIPFLAIENKYPGGHCYNAREAMISLTSWGDDEQQIKATINHELHHMARWHNPGYGKTLGGAILSEGIATYYEELQSGWLSPWAEAAFDDETLKAALEEWDNATYNHREWFFNGPHGKWVGYAIGYKLAKLLFKDGFDLSRSITIEQSEALSYAKQLGSSL